MLKLARLFIFTLFIFCNYSYADIRVEVGEESDAFEEVLMDDIRLSSEEKKMIQGHHKKIIDHHKDKIGKHDYEVIHIAKDAKGYLHSAIRFKDSDGNKFVYQLTIRNKRASYKGFGPLKIAQKKKRYDMSKEKTSNKNTDRKLEEEHKKFNNKFASKWKESQSNADKYPSESHSTKGKSFEDINKGGSGNAGSEKPQEEKGWFRTAWAWFSGADQKVKFEKPPQGGTKTDGRPKQGSNYVSSGKTVPPTPPKGSAGNLLTQEEWVKHKNKKSKEERRKQNKEKKNQKPALRSEKKEDLINKTWRKDNFLNGSHKRGSGWVSGATEDTVDDANDALINH